MCTYVCLCVWVHVHTCACAHGMFTCKHVKVHKCACMRELHKEGSVRAGPGSRVKFCQTDRKWQQKLYIHYLTSLSLSPQM